MAWVAQDIEIQSWVIIDDYHVGLRTLEAILQLQPFGCSGRGIRARSAAGGGAGRRRHATGRRASRVGRRGLRADLAEAGPLDRTYQPAAADLPCDVRR